MVLFKKCSAEFKQTLNKLYFYPAQDCGPLAVPINGSSNGDLTVFPNKIVFGCDEGFLLGGSDMRHCLANGTWSGNQTFCEGC